MAYEHILYETADRVALITINRPAALNALNPPTNAELDDAFRTFNADDELWVAIITGAGERAFSAGADLKWRLEHPEEQPRELDSHTHRFVGTLQAEIWKPIIAAVRGWCLGAGFEIALACDMIVATPDAQFGLPEVRNIGAPPGGGGPLRAPRKLPQNIAMEMLLTGDPISVTEAHRLGLINHIVPDPFLLTKARALAARICENPPYAVREIKEIGRRGLDRPLDHPPDAWDLYVANSQRPSRLADARSRGATEGWALRQRGKRRGP